MNKGNVIDALGQKMPMALAKQIVEELMAKGRYLHDLGDGSALELLFNTRSNVLTSRVVTYGVAMEDILDEQAEDGALAVPELQLGEPDGEVREVREDEGDGAEERGGRDRET